MKRKTLASTGQLVSEIGFGCWQLGGKGWGSTDTGEAARAVSRALELGIDLFDTAPVYGFGRSEELLGKALGESRLDAVVISKGGIVWDERGRVMHDNSPESLRAQLEGSLKRLRREALDVFLIHWPDARVPLDVSAAALEALKDEGRIRAWGVSNFALVELRSFDKLVLELPLNLLGEHAPEYAESGSVARGELLGEATGRWDVLAFDVLARGLLAARYDGEARFGKRDLRSKDHRFQGRTFRENIRRLEPLKAIADAHAVAPAAVALRATLDWSGVVACLVGMRSAAQVEENVRAGELELSGEELGVLARL